MCILSVEYIYFLLQTSQVQEPSMKSQNKKIKIKVFWDVMPWQPLNISQKTWIFSNSDLRTADLPTLRWNFFPTLECWKCIYHSKSECNFILLILYHLHISFRWSSRLSFFLSTSVNWKTTTVKHNLFWEIYSLLDSRGILCILLKFKLYFHVHQSLPLISVLAIWIQPTPCYPVYWKSVSVLSNRLHFGLPPLTFSNHNFHMPCPSHPPSCDHLDIWQGV